MVKYVTKNLPKAFLLSSLVIILSFYLFGCGGTFRSFPGEGDISGSWGLALTPSGASELAPVTATLNQTDGNISGTTSDGATITGTISGNNVDLTLNNANTTTTTLTGTGGGDWKTMAGTFTSTGSAGSGTWSASKNVSKSLAVSPTSATLSCTGTAGSQSQIFTVTGGTQSKYSVTAASNASLIALATDTLTTNGKFTVTADSTCTGGASADVGLTVTDTATSINVTVTVTNP